MLVNQVEDIFYTSACTVVCLVQLRGGKKHCVILAGIVLCFLYLFFSKAALWSSCFSLAWLAMKQVQKVWGVFSKSQLVRGHVCTVSIMCLAPRSVQLSRGQLLRKGFRKPTVHSHSPRQCLSRFSSILSGVCALLWKSAYSGIDPSFKFSETIFLGSLCILSLTLP